MYETIKYEVNGNIAIVTISREQALNALNRQVLEDLDKVLDEIKADKDLRGLVITGAGRSFVAGADIAAMSTMNEEEGFQFGVYGAGVFRKIELLDIPVVAAVNGFALGGGCELAMSTDYIVASEKAKFGQPEAGLGITPGFGGTQRLARKIGESKAKELIFSARVIGAQEARLSPRPERICKGRLSQSRGRKRLQNECLQHRCGTRQAYDRRTCRHGRELLPRSDKGTQ